MVPFLVKRSKIDGDQIRRCQEAAQDAGADMSKEEFGRVVGGLAKRKPRAQDQEKRDEKPARDE